MKQPTIAERSTNARPEHSVWLTLGFSSLTKPLLWCQWMPQETHRTTVKMTRCQSLPIRTRIYCSMGMPGCLTIP